MKLTEAQIDVLKAYRDDSTHNRAVSVLAFLLRNGYLVSTFVNHKHTIVIMFLSPVY